MSDIATIRAAIVARIGTVPAIGIVHDRERYSRTLKDLAALFKSGSILLGWTVSRVSTREIRIATGRHREDHTWRITGYRSFEDAESSETLFDAQVEQVRAAFRTETTLGGAVATINTENQAGLQVREIGPVVFSDVLCHRAVCGLITTTYRTA